MKLLGLGWKYDGGVVIAITRNGIVVEGRKAIVPLNKVVVKLCGK